jgi:hypothetical protein
MQVQVQPKVAEIKGISEADNLRNIVNLRSS